MHLNRLSSCGGKLSRFRLWQVSSPVTAFIVLTSVAALASCSSHGVVDHNSPHDGKSPSSAGTASFDYDALFVVNGGDSTVSVINTATNQVTDTIELEDAPFPHHLYLNADASKMLLAVPGVDLSMGHSSGAHAGHGAPVVSGAVLLLSTTTGATLRARTLEATNHNAVFSPDGTEVWTSQMTAPGAVLVLDAESLDDKQTIEVGEQPAEVTFSADGVYAFVANGASDSVTVIDASTKELVKTIPTGDGPVGAWQGSNGVAYVDNEPGQSLTAVDTSSLEVLLTYELGFMPGMAAFGPDRQVWVTDAENGKVVFYSTSMDGATGEIATGPGAHAIAFNGSGSMAYISNQLGDTVSVIELESGRVVSTIPVGSKPNGLAWRSR